MFKYLVCLDFEATCWRSGDFSAEEREIIEFGAVLLNLTNGEIEDKFHHYVRPVRNPTLSSYCINLTGITQSLIDHQETFPTIYQKFDDWIQCIQRNKNVRFATPFEKRADINGINATFCSWTNYDLNMFFKIECQRLVSSNLVSTVPDCFKAWIDIRPSFNLNYSIERCTFADALKLAQIDTVGNAHSAINDASNLAKLVKKLVNRGVQFTVTTTWTFY